MTTEDIAAVLATATRLDPEPADNRALADLPLNDYGNARRLIARRGHDLIWVKESGWHIWTGQLWRRDQEQGGGALMVAHEVAEAIRYEVETLENEFTEEHSADLLLWPLGEIRKINDGLEIALLVQRINAHRAWKSMSGNHPRIEAMLKASAPYLKRGPEELDADPLVLNVQNGTLHMHFGDLDMRDHDRGDLCTRISNAEYDRNAECPGFREFIRMIMPDKETARFLQVVFGYGLTAEIGEQVMLILFGKGANGKSTFLNCVAAATGEYTMNAPVESFLYQERKGGADASPDLARLPGARIVLTSEPEVGSRLSESRVKSITGGEKMAVRLLHKNFFEFLPTFKLVLSCNSKPTIRGNDHGIWRRVRMIPFGVQIPEERKILNAHELYIKGELSGILNWLLDGFRIWVDEGLISPAAVKSTTDEYRMESDPIGEFARWAICDSAGDLSSTRIYKLYSAWCHRDGFEPVKHAFFGRRLGDLGFKKQRAGIVYYTGVSFTGDAQEFEDSLSRDADPPPSEDYRD